MKSVSPKELMDDAKRVFPEATWIEIRCITEAEFIWMKVVTTGLDYSECEYEPTCRLAVQERSAVVFTAVGDTIAELSQQLDEHEKQRILVPTGAGS